MSTNSTFPDHKKMSNLSFLNFHGLSRKSSLKSFESRTYNRSFGRIETRAAGYARTTQLPGEAEIMSKNCNNNVSRKFQPNVDEMKWVFDKFYTNKDGKISLQEYKAALGGLGRGNIEDSEMVKAFQATDSDGDGFLDFKEFMGMMQNMGEGAKSSDIEGAFRVFDLDGDGKISTAELMEVLKRMGERCSLDACQKMIRAVDRDGDGLIDIYEFMSMMTRTMKGF